MSKMVSFFLNLLTWDKSLAAASHQAHYWWAGSTSSRLDQDMPHNSCGPINHPVYLQIPNPKVGKKTRGFKTPRPQEDTGFSASMCTLYFAGLFLCALSVCLVHMCVSLPPMNSFLQLLIFICSAWDFSANPCCASDFFLLFNFLTNRENEPIKTPRLRPLCCDKDISSLSPLKGKCVCLCMCTCTHVNANICFSNFRWSLLVAVVIPRFKNSNHQQNITIINLICQ